MKNYKTTITGVLTIVVAISTAALSYMQTGHLPDVGPLIAAVTAGAGLITARDSKPTDLTPTEASVVKAQVAPLTPSTK